MSLLFVNYPSWLSPYLIPGIVRWYSLMYIVAFSVAYVLFSYQRKHDGTISLNSSEQQDFFFFTIIFLLVFARIFSAVFYIDAHYYLTHPWMIFWPFSGGKFTGLAGMSYHGGVFGAVLGCFIYTKRKKKNFMEIADVSCAAIPLGYTFGRLGNFFNAELYGRVTKSPIGMIFPDAERLSTRLEWVRDVADSVGIMYREGDLVNLPRHPSQLYEALFEGVLLFLFLWFVVRRVKIKRKLNNGIVFSFYLIGYGLVRFFIEYCRQPDREIGYVIKAGKGEGNIALFESFLNISKGQIFCLLMVGAGLIMAVIVLKGGKNGNSAKDRGSQKNTKRKKS